MAPKFFKNLFTKPKSTTTNQNPNNDNDNDNEGSPFSFCLRLPSTSTSTSTSTPIPLAGLHPPPLEYVCLVCFALMSDPVSLPSSSHNSFHPHCLQSYHHLHPFTDADFSPTLNQPLKNQIHQWCVTHNRLPPPPTSRSHAQQAARTLLLHTTNNQEPPPQRTVPADLQTTRTHLENILIDLRDSRTFLLQNALTALAEYTNPDNRSYLCCSVVLDPVLSMFFSHTPSTTSAAVAFLLNLSTDISTRYKIAHHANAALVACLIDSVAGRWPGFAIPNTRDEAAVTLYNLALEVRNKTLMGSVNGLLFGLLDYWLREASTASRRGRQSAGWAVKNLVTSCPENLVRLMREEERVVERVLEMARRKEEGISTVRRPAFSVLGEMAGAGEKEGRTKLVKGQVMEEMVRMLVEKEVEKWCLEVMWKMCCGGMNGWEFKAVAMEAGAELVLSEMRGGWGQEGLEMAEGMLKVMRKKYRKSQMARPVDMLDPVAEEEEGDSGRSAGVSIGRGGGEASSSS